MYTRNQGNTRITPATKTSSGTADGISSFGAGFGRGGAGNTADLPLLIPQDYHGEFLRERRISEPTETEPPQRSDTVEVSGRVYAEPPAEEITALANEDEIPQIPELPARQEERGNSLIGGLYDLLLGENSSDEETLLLLGIGLLLLWGHLDRGGLFDRSSWESDDLALLLIGYLLLS